MFCRANLAAAIVAIFAVGLAPPARAERRRGGFHGHGVSDPHLRAAPLPRPSGDIWIWAPGIGEELVTNIYNPDGSFDQQALADLDRLFRCRRTGEHRAADPRLYELLSMIHDHFGARVELTSGFRFQKNQGSRHFHAAAMDIRVAGVSTRELFRYATTLDTGGLGTACTRVRGSSTSTSARRESRAIAGPTPGPGGGSSRRDPTRCSRAAPRR